MSSGELEILDQLLDSSRRVNKFIDELRLRNPEIAERLKTQLNHLTDKALEVYFHEDKNPEQLKTLLEEVNALVKSPLLNNLAA